MKLPRVSLVSIEFVIVVLAVNFGVMRALYDSSTGSITEGGSAMPAFLLLPMIDLLLIGLFRLRRRDRRTPRAIGFVMVGSAASLAVFTSCVVAPGDNVRGPRAIGRPIAMGTMNGMTRHLGNAAMQSTIMQLAAWNSLRGPVPDGVFRSPASILPRFPAVGSPIVSRIVGGESPRYKAEKPEAARNGHFCPLKLNSCVYLTRPSLCVDKSAENGRR